MPRPPAYLLAGPEELLLRRAADQVLAELREEAAGDLDVTEVRASELGEHGLPDLRTASLFGGARAVVIREAQDLPAEASAALAAELEGTPPDAAIVLLATGTGRIQKLAKRVKELGGRVDVAPPKDWEDAKWAALVAAEFQRHGRAAAKDAVQAILSHAGLDVGGIAEKVAQVCATAPAGQVGAEHVEAVVVGHGNRGSFAVADAMCDRDAAEALRLLRGVLDGGDDPVMVLGALAYRLRSIVAVAAGVDGKAVGLNISPGQARRLQGVRRNFGPGELTRAYRLLARADVEIKGGVLPPQLVIERAVAEIATRG
ncbi:MAG TPA: DNA polymerase III subunit delta [Egibacteraceae bacterium]|nr:DNA polymerase III subunit delta [Egibacteraceae bacterium]